MHKPQRSTPVLFLACALGVAALPLRMGAEGVDDPVGYPAYTVQVNDKPVLTLPANPANKLEITADKITRINADTMDLTSARITLTLPGHAPVVIEGAQLTLVTLK